jgi:hypothetical protein
MYIAVHCPLKSVTGTEKLLYGKDKKNMKKSLLTHHVRISRMLNIKTVDKINNAGYLSIMKPNTKLFNFGLITTDNNLLTTHLFKNITLGTAQI